MEKYNNLRKHNRVCFHIMWISLILLVMSIIALDIVFIIIFSILLVSSFLYFLKTRKSLNEMQESFTKECPLCKGTIKLEEEVNYLLNGALTDKTSFDVSIEDSSKRVIRVKTYKCENDNFKYTIIETFYFGSKGELKLLNTKKNVNIG